MSDSFSSDLRRAGTQAKRAHDSKAKWAYGIRGYPSDKLPRPAMPTTHYSKQIRHAKRECQHNLNKAISADKVTLRHDVREYLDDTTSSEDEAEPTSLPVSSTPTSPTTASPEMDSEDPYEYDTTGHAILSDAVNKAVEKYETRKAEKIVKEYEMVPRESEASVGGYMSDGFEVVEIV